MTLSSSQSSSLASWGMDFCIPLCKSGFSVTDKGATVLLCCTSSLSPSPQLCSYSPWILSCYKSSLHSFYVFFFFCLCIITQMSVYISPHSAALLSCLSCLCFFFASNLSQIDVSIPYICFLFHPRAFPRCIRISFCTTISPPRLPPTPRRSITSSLRLCHQSQSFSLTRNTTVFLHSWR